MSDHDEQKLRQLAEEQAAAAPPAHGWDHVRGAAAVSSRHHPDRRRWLAAAAAAVLVVGAVVVAAVRVADAPSSISTADPTSPTAPAPDTAPPEIATIAPEPDEGADPDHDDPVVDQPVDDEPAGVAIPHRMLVDGAPVGPVWTTSVADTPTELDAMWSELGLTDAANHAELPEVEFDTSVVVHFGPAESGSCPFGELASVRHDPDTGYLFPQLPLADPVAAGEERACTADANSHTIVVAIDRIDLPTDDFEIWVENSAPPACCVNGVTRVAAGELKEVSPPSIDDLTAEPVDGVYESVPTIPSGQLEVGDLDLFIAHVDGDLWLHPGILGDTPSAPIRLAQFGDPREPVAEGPGPNQVDQVAGVFDGSALYSDCCEPVSGNLIAATGPDSERIVWGMGYTPVFNPDGTQLVSANWFSLTVVDLTAGVLRERPLLDEDPAVFFDVWDVTWTANGQSIVLLTSDEGGHSLRHFGAASPFVAEAPVSIGIGRDEGRAAIAGRRADGAIAIAVTDGPGAPVVRFFDPESLEQLPDTIELPAGATAVRMDEDDRLLWVQGDQLWYRSTGAQPRPLGDGYRAAWFSS